MGMQTLLALAFKVNEAAHGIQKPPGNGKSKTKTAHKTIASGIRLIKVVVHLKHL